MKGEVVDIEHSIHGKVFGGYLMRLAYEVDDFIPSHEFEVTHSS